MSIYDTIASGKMWVNQFDGEFFEAGHRGTLLLHCLELNTKDLVTRAFLKAEILSTEGTTQPKGTIVKKMYALSQNKWAKNELLTDLARILDLDPKSLPEGVTVSDIVRDAFGATKENPDKVDPTKSSLRGVVCAFTTSVVYDKETGEVRTYKSGGPVVEVRFKALPNENASEEQVKARADRIK